MLHMIPGFLSKEMLDIGGYKTLHFKSLITGKILILQDAKGTTSSIKIAYCDYINRLTNKFGSSISQSKLGLVQQSIYQNIKLLIEKCSEYNIQIYLVFADCNVIVSVGQISGNASNDSRRRTLLKEIYNKASSRLLSRKIIFVTISNSIPLT